MRFISRHRTAVVLVVTAALAAGAAVWFSGALRPLMSGRAAPAPFELRYLSTGLYKIEAAYVRNVVPTGPAEARGIDPGKNWWGGGLALFGDRYLLANGDGRMFLLEETAPGERPAIRPVGLQIPVNVDEFLADADVPFKIQTFRVADILVQPVDGRYRLFASYHRWNSADRCSVMRVSWVEGSAEEIAAEAPVLEWRTLFETTPCLPFKHRAVRFGGLQNGGKMALVDADTILMTVGDHEFDGYYAERSLPQDPGSSYGKTVLLSVPGGDAEIFTVGHRNAEGLFIDSSGSIWSTEHGPKGGDELNLLAAGANYGWPLVSHGTAYDKTVWPPAGPNLRHEGYVQPVFAWFPSVGTSDVVGASGPEFAMWKGDLLVATLTARDLLRLRVIDGRVLYEEPIEIGCRMRDLLETPDGRFIVWCDHDDTLIFLSEPHGDDNGELLFAQCEGCHSLDNRDNARLGPDLRGVGQRKIASEAGFDYSPALEAMGDRRWSAEDLDAFIADPQAYAPGTSMNYAGLQDERKRDAIVRYLIGVQD